jgi:uncharacterized protein (TIGR02270 family)
MSDGRDRGGVDARAAQRWSVVEEHLDEAEFMFDQWRSGLEAATYSLADLEDRVEDRLLANVDGLVTAGARARDELTRPALADGPPARAAAAAWALLASPEADAGAVLDALGDDDEARREALGRAIGIASREGLDDALAARAAVAEGDALAALLDVIAFRGVGSSARWLEVGTAAPAPLLVAALRAGRAAGGETAAWLARESLASTSAAVRAEAFTTGVVLGAPEAWEACRAAARATDADARCLLLTAMLGDARDVEAVIDATLSPGTRDAALFALGFSGRVAAADACLARVDDEDEDAARLAGEAFVAITGYPVGHHEVAPPPAGLDAPGFVLRVRPEDALPVLDAARARAFWAKARARFDAKGRSLHGAPLGAASVRALLDRGPMRRRHAVALEIAARTRGRSWVETRALAARQRVELARLASLSDADLARPVG